MILLVLIALGAYFGGSAVFQANVAPFLEASLNFGNRWGRRIIIVAAMALIIWPCILIGSAMLYTVREVKKGEELGFVFFAFPAHWWATALVLLLIVCFCWIGVRCFRTIPDAVGRAIGGTFIAVAALFFLLLIMGGTRITILGAGVYDFRWVTLVLAFVPLLVAVGIVIWAPPLAWAAPAIVNALASQIEDASRRIEWAVRHAPGMGTAPIAVAMPRVPPLKTLLKPVVMFSVASLLMGCYLYLVPVKNDPILLLFLVIVVISLAAFSYYNTAKGLQRLLKLAAVVITVLICLSGRAQATSRVSDRWSELGNTVANYFKGEKGGDISGYNPLAICGLSAAPAGGVSQMNLNNPLNIKFSPFVKTFGGKNSDVAARDGGTFAQFDSPEQGLWVGRILLESEAYSSLTIDAAMRKWSNGGYGGEIVADILNPDRRIRDLLQPELAKLIAAMQQREGGSSVGTVNVARPSNDHSGERIEQFEVPLSAGCFGDWVRVPSYWRSWDIDFVHPNDQDQYVGFWFWPAPRSMGPYHRFNMPDLSGYPQKWRLQGRGRLQYTRTS